MNEFDLVGPQFLLLYSAVTFGTAFGALVVRVLLANVKQDFPALDLNPYEAAYLSSGDERVVDAAVANLVHTNVLTATALPPSIKATGTLPANAHPVEQSVFRSVQFHMVTNVRDLYQYVLPVSQHIRPKLVEAGLILNDSRTAVIRTICTLLTLSPIVFLGAPKVLVGMSRHKPVLLLVALCGLGLLFSYLFFRQKCIRTSHGEWALDYLRGEHRALEYSVGHGSPATGAELALALGLFGTGLLATSPAFANLNPVIRPTYSSGIGSGGGCASGGSCGGGGCGGGCGGCGG